MTDEALHFLARVLLRVCSPRQAHSILVRIGARLPVRVDRADIEAAATRLRARGSCLSRSLALAARIPDADVVIGVAPRRGERLFAHAWVELRGEALNAGDGAGNQIQGSGAQALGEIGRLRGSRSTA